MLYPSYQSGKSDPEDPTRKSYETYADEYIRRAPSSRLLKKSFPSPGTIMARTKMLASKSTGGKRSITL